MSGQPVARRPLVTSRLGATADDLLERWGRDPLSASAGWDAGASARRSRRRPRCCLRHIGRVQHLYASREELRSWRFLRSIPLDFGIRSISAPLSAWPSGWIWRLFWRGPCRPPATMTSGSSSGFCRSRPPSAWLPACPARTSPNAVAILIRTRSGAESPAASRRGRCGCWRCSQRLRRVRRGDLLRPAACIPDRSAADRARERWWRGPGRPGTAAPPADPHDASPVSSRVSGARVSSSMRPHRSMGRPPGDVVTRARVVRRVSRLSIPATWDTWSLMAVRPRHGGGRCAPLVGAALSRGA